MSGPGFTQRPEIPEDRRTSRFKPWVSKVKHYRPRHGARWIMLVGAPRGLRHDPERTTAKAFDKRVRQGKAHR